MSIFSKFHSIKSQLKKLVKADEELSKSYPSSDAPYAELTTEHINLERRRIGLAFDELKVQIKDWSTLNPKDEWKLQKPKYAYGHVFIMLYTDLVHKFSNRYNIPTLDSILDQDITVRKAIELGVEPYMFSAFKTTTERKLLAQSQATLGTGVHDPITSYHLYTQLLDCTDSYFAVSGIGIPIKYNDTLKALAIKSGVNIVTSN